MSNARARVRPHSDRELTLTHTRARATCRHHVRNTVTEVGGKLNCDQLAAVAEVRLNGVSLGSHGRKGGCECGTCDTVTMGKWDDEGLNYRGTNSITYHLVYGSVSAPPTAAQPHAAPLTRTTAAVHVRAPHQDQLLLRA